MSYVEVKRFRESWMIANSGVLELHVLMQILGFSLSSDHCKLLVSVEQGMSFEIERGDLKPDVTDSRL